MKTSSIHKIDIFFDKHKDLLFLKLSIIEIIQLLVNNFYKGGKILICGNGGSAADSEHIVGELMKGFVLKRDLKTSLLDRINKIFPEDTFMFKNNLQLSIPAISLVSQTGLISAFNNDKNSDFVYAQQVLGYANPFDSLICISTSGNSKNILYAAKIAKVLNIPVISLTGFNGGKLRELTNHLINVPSNVISEIQEYHLPIYHLICLVMEEEIYSE